MNIKYKHVVILSLLMALFYFVPFWKTGWSTDVFIHLNRIAEWVQDGFPFTEQLMRGQNYPFGHEMHWTRPLDFIGYAGAWPFIPNWGLKKALEIMSFYVPLLAMLSAVGGFYYGLKGYLKPLPAFVVFWLFFYEFGYVWGQSTVGYFDQHVFHVSLLIWALACVLQYFRAPSKKLLISSGVLVAVGTWITFEFFMTLFFISVPFLAMWLFYHKSLKPLLIFCASFIITLFLAMTFDHPISGFLTLDFHRASLLHCILGGAWLIYIALLNWAPRFLTITWIRRLLFSALLFELLAFIIYTVFGNYIFIFTDPVQYHLWISKVSEMGSIYKKPAVLYFSVFPVLFGILGVIRALRFSKKSISSPLLMLGVGLIAYALFMAIYIREGLGMNAYFVLFMGIYTASFFEIKTSFKKEGVVLFILLLLFFASLKRANGILVRFQVLSYDRLYEQYKNNPDLKDVPQRYLDSFKEKLEKEQAKETDYDEKGRLKPAVQKKREKEKEEKKVEDRSFGCSVPDEIIKKIRADKKNGSIWTDIFSAPQILWETQKPVYGGPYHTNLQGLRDLFTVQLDTTPNFKTVQRIFKMRQTTQVFMQNPRCFQYLFYDEETGKFKEDLKNFYYAVYYETKKMPSWIELEYVDEATQVKLFRVIPEKLK